ncbi:UDP-glucose 4-epimerase GalE [Streptomyces panaciradicis]|uniref:UDP-glucose 4-epimerase GalE n=1 Tax=Streptomyces panaciradicis TaxID=1470261 RepID=UPI00201D1029|nr:UDP-glucose 4-epimerase GalE [Streptomyces panaciradicis]MCL6670907.1 UDP-glucose 4-epimerase GalE [Streptomyces panaciradicis]
MSQPRTILVTGGAGFIGSHTCVELLTHGHDVIVVDNHQNSVPEALHRVEQVARRSLAASYVLDVRDREALSAVFASHTVDAVIHFAGRKAVGESVRMPVQYYDTNVGGTTALLEVMSEHGVHRLVFSSSCSVYGVAERMPLTEAHPTAPVNPYARSKLTCEQILADVCAHRSEFTVHALRYFNPVGAHPSGLLGEDPMGVPDNVMPYLAQVAAGRREHVTVFGDDWPTPDGTGVRDYIHVMDVAEGHRIALEHPASHGMHLLNLGSGQGTSVLQLIEAYQQAAGRPVPYRIGARRPGDVPELIADGTAAGAAWNWRPTRDLAAMCRDSWHFQLNNPHGYRPHDLNAGPVPGPGPVAGATTTPTGPRAHALRSSA